MGEKGFKRKLTAILSADVAGYSRMMRDDEDSTIRTLTAYRSAMSNLIKKFRGNVVDATGDNLLAEFTSVMDAVNCAVEIQRELAQRNAALSEERKMEFRIGVNLGDVVEEEGSIYGDGVNIAARMEGLAEVGSICISGSVYDSVESKLALEYKYLGEQEVKNIDKPVRAYRISSFPGAAGHRIVGVKKVVGRKWRNIAWVTVAILVVAIAVAAIWKMYLRRVLSVEPTSVEKPSLAVLPFDNLSGDAEQEYFVDGMTDELITNLSKISGLLIISRNSSFTYKGKPTKIEQVAKELNVRYVLEGSVQRDGDRVRIRAQLIDGATDHHLWAESYEGVMENIFGLQDEITRKIASELAVKLSGEEQERLKIKETDNLEAYDAFLKGREYVRHRTPDGFSKALSYYKLATELDSNYSRAHANLANLYILSSRSSFPLEWREKMGVRLERARLLARTHLEIAMSKPTSTAHVVASWMTLFRRRFNEANTHTERAIAMDPNEPEAYRAMARLLNYTGRPQEGLEFVKKSIRLDPHDIADDLGTMAMAQICMGEFEKAATIVENALMRYPDIHTYYLDLAISYAHLGRTQEAKSAYEKVLSRFGGPKPDLAIHMSFLPFKSTQCADIVADGLLKAGCPGQPSGYYKIYAENRLTGKEVRELIYGHKLNLFYGNHPIWIDHSKDGKANFKGFGQSYGGTWRIKDDMLCYRWERPDLLGLDECQDTYRNPDSTARSKKKYIGVFDFGIFPFSIEK